MAWCCSSKTNAGMVAALQREGLIKTREVIEAMRRVDRGWFVHNPEEAYCDRPVPIGFGVTISAPHMHAIMLELASATVLNYRSVDQSHRLPLRLLDIGSGSGYMTAAFASLCEASWREGVPQMFEVIGVEHVLELQKKSEHTIKTHFPDWIQDHRVTLLHGDGRKPHAIAGVGVGSGEAFDVIHVGATTPKALVPVYFRLLRQGGTLVVPVGDPGEAQELQVFTKDSEGDIKMRTVCGVQFVPLTSLKAQLSWGTKNT